STSSQRLSPVRISATRHLSLSPLTKRNAVSTCATTVAEFPTEEISLMRTASDGNSIPAMRAIKRRASLGLRSLAARVWVAIMAIAVAMMINNEMMRHRRFSMFDLLRSSEGFLRFFKSELRLRSAHQHSQHRLKLRRRKGFWKKDNGARRETV